MVLHAGLISCTEPSERRNVARRTLRLQLATVAVSGAKPALVYNLSERGLFVETEATLQPGDVLIVELPEAGATPAEVIWARGYVAGCEFAKPLPAATVSAALLRADPKPRPEDSDVHAQDEQWKARTAGIESRWVNLLFIASLLLALLVACLFSVALLTAPFSVR